MSEQDIDIKEIDEIRRYFAEMPVKQKTKFTPKEAISILRDEILQLQGKGYTVQEIHIMLAEKKITISLNTLKRAIKFMSETTHEQEKNKSKPKKEQVKNNHKTTIEQQNDTQKTIKKQQDDIEKTNDEQQEIRNETQPFQKEYPNNDIETPKKIITKSEEETVKNKNENDDGRAIQHEGNKKETQKTSLESPIEKQEEKKTGTFIIEPDSDVI